MALYNDLIKELNAGDRLCKKAADIIGHLQETVRFYNSDDAIFDDEKEKVAIENLVPDPFNAVITHEIADTGIFLFEKSRMP